jgi:hypothetical protein
VSQLQSEVENLALRLFYMQVVNADLHSDITAMKNTSRKPHSEKPQAETHLIRDQPNVSSNVNLSEPNSKTGPGPVAKGLEIEFKIIRITMAESSLSLSLYPPLNSISIQFKGFFGMGNMLTLPKQVKNQ